MTEEQRPVALVSGGSRGIGRAVVEHLAATGYDVAFCYSARPDGAEATASAAGEHGARTLAAQADVTDAGAVKDLVASTESELGPIELVVTSAGITRDTPLLMMKDDDWHDVVDVNLSGVYNVCRAAVFPMLKRRAGAFVTISSVAGVHGNAGQANYASSKAGIIGFTKSLAKEVGKYGIRANAVVPGFIDTDMTTDIPEGRRDEIMSQIPLGRWGGAAEVAELVGFLGSPRASYITSSVLAVDGGLVI